MAVLILTALNLGGQRYEMILTPLIAFLVAELLVIQYAKITDCRSNIRDLLYSQFAEVSNFAK